MAFQLSFEKNPHPNNVQILGDGIMAYAKQQKNLKPLDFFAFFIRDANNTIVGGCNGSTLYGCLYIDQLWVSELLRNQGWGTKLVESAIQYGKEHDCTFATVNTMDWEALGFYQKLGFQIEFERRGFLKNSVFYFLRKELVALNTSIHNNQLNSSKQQLHHPDQVISIENASHFLWGKDCEGWWLKNDDNFTVIYEKMPAGSSEIKHYHNKTEQFFYCLQGQLVIEFDNQEQILNEQEGLCIKSQVAHKAKNISKTAVLFLVISSPNSHQDRINLE